MLASIQSRPTDEVEAWCDRFRATCRERGVRVTQQRLEVYRALAADLTHPSVETLYDRLQRRLPTLSLATVYRVLESLERAGLVRRVTVDDGPARFDANVAPHQHLVCRVCGRVRDTNVTRLQKIAPPAEPAAGFVAERLDIRILGVCADCAGASF